MQKLDETIFHNYTRSQPSALNLHSIIHQLDQTTLRLCASLLGRIDEIILFGRTCHTLYATLNHPVTWTYTNPQTVSEWCQLSYPSRTPFLQFLPCLWWMTSQNLFMEELTHAASRLSQLPYRLVGLNIEASSGVGSNEWACELVASLLKDVHMTNHLSRVIISPFRWGSDQSDLLFMPNKLLTSILQLSQLHSLSVQVNSFTIQFANLLSQATGLTALEIQSYSRSESSFLATLSAPSSGLIHSLTELSLCWSIYDNLVENLDCLRQLHRLRTLKLDGPISAAGLIKLIVPLSRISLQHLHLTTWHPNASCLIELVREMLDLSEGSINAPDSSHAILYPGPIYDTL